MRRAIATVSLSGTLEQKLRAIAAARFDAIELFEADFIQHRGSAREVASICADLGLAIDLYQPFRDFEGMPDEVFRRSLDRAERKFDLMQALGAPLLLVCSNTSPAAIDDPARCAAQLRELAERAARRNLRIGYEALAWGRHVKRWRQAWEIVERAAHPHLGLILDSFHTLSLRDDPAGIAALPGERIFFVQMADAPLLAMDVVQWARHHRNFPGQGQFDVTSFFEQVLRSGYTGTLSLEIFNDVFRATPNRRIAVDAMRSLLDLESRVRARLARDPAGRAAIGRVALADPPRAGEWDGLAFVEFGADDATATALGQWLARLGFERAGSHKTKRVTLYRQGEINLVVDAQPGGDARARFDEQGAGVSAIGLLADDPVRASARATALLSARFDPPRGADELALPAIRSPGGMLVHFAAASLGPQGLAAADFGVAPEVSPPAGAGLRRIDHLALGMTADQLDTWVLFARAVLGLEAGESLELADPFGLVRSCSVASADRKLRLVLNVAAGPHTGIARTLAAAGGKPGVHHLAFGCDDIFAAVEAMRARGTAFVPISDNYHDDLLARFDLDPALVERMRRLGILYDRSADGEFFHAYTEPFEGRFFAEVVERRGYDAYGAAGNAAARMAALAQRDAPA